MTPMRKRLDALIVERGLADSREKAQRLIRAGVVLGAHEVLDKPGRMIAEDAAITIRGDDCPYVSRGGLKLAGALDSFAVSVANRVAVDIGASTGGFTDCLLQRGSVKVYAIDVGRGQLHQRIASDPRVVSRERTHLDSLEAEQFDPRPDLAVVDISFISLRRAFAPLARILTPGAEVVALAKPQFEVGKDRLPRGGVVTDPAEWRRVLDDLRVSADGGGYSVLGECESPIAGGDGNREFFLHLRVR